MIANILFTLIGAAIGFVAAWLIGVVSLGKDSYDYDDGEDI